MIESISKYLVFKLKIVIHFYFLFFTSENKKFILFLLTNQKRIKKIEKNIQKPQHSENSFFSIVIFIVQFKISKNFIFRQKLNFSKKFSKKKICVNFFHHKKVTTFFICFQIPQQYQSKPKIVKKMKLNTNPKKTKQK